LRENKTIKCSRELSRTCGLIHRFQQDYEKNHGRAPTLEELCHDLQLSRETVLLALGAAHSQNVASLDEPLSEDEEVSLGDTICDTQKGPSIEDHLDLSASLASLPLPEQQLIRLRYYQNKTQTQTAKLLGLTQVQVCRMEKRILKSLRQKILYQSG
ncbi:MAG: sigma-70 family RNA polymerase sigma factor, partial [Firmicutes bacterium]|nr:sigma-70 family RNA polymerase sigma factor [Bacillota bacterium]